MRLQVEFKTDFEARRAIEDLEAAGFDKEAIRVAHPMEGGAIVKIDAWGPELSAAFEVLSRHESSTMGGADQPWL
jgi:hypothetical protein